MRVRVLGAAAGGGFPQWNCGCANCRAVRAREPGWRARTQDCLAVIASDDAAILCNASPDLARQLEATVALHPRAPRHTPISAIVLTNGDLDHVLGLLSLREAQPLAIYATETVRRSLVERNALFATLARFPGQSVWRPLELDRERELADPAGKAIGVAVRARAVPGKPPAHLRGAHPSPEDNIALELRDVRTDRRVVYAPNAAAPVPGLGDGAELLLFDGTFWSDDELGRAEVGAARAAEMAHLPIGGADGSLARVRPSCRHKLFTHINNTNPILAPSSPERLAVRAAGWDIADDGMELAL
jgi:pyrroloquinoline quinone biosynthesis protein B